MIVQVPCKINKIASCVVPYCSVNILLCEVFCEVFDVFSHILEQVCLENLKDPGQDIKVGPSPWCDDCFNRIFDCSIKIY